METQRKRNCKQCNGHQDRKHIGSEHKREQVKSNRGRTEGKKTNTREALKKSDAEHTAQMLNAANYKAVLDPSDEILKELEAGVDSSFVDSAMTLANLFRVMCVSSLMLPDMDLDFDYMRVKNTVGTLSVTLRRNRLEADDKESKDFGDFFSVNGHARGFDSNPEDDFDDIDGDDDDLDELDDDDDPDDYCFYDYFEEGMLYDGD